MEIGKTYFLSINGIPYIYSFWRDVFTLLDSYPDGTLVLYNLRLDCEFYIDESLVEVIDIYEVN